MLCFCCKTSIPSLIEHLTIFAAKRGPAEQFYESLIIWPEQGKLMKTLNLAKNTFNSRYGNPENYKSLLIWFD